MRPLLRSLAHVHTAAALDHAEDEFEAPVIKDYEEKECLISWLMDEQVT